MKNSNLEKALIKLTKMNNPYIDIILIEELEKLIIRGLSVSEIVEYGEELNRMQLEKDYTYQVALSK